CRAIADVRKSGKKVFAYLESGNTKDYLVALACDEICLPESDWLMLTGMRAEVSFYKDLFEKIGVQADMLQMGDFKAAAEPFMRNSMSKPAREQLTRVIDDYFENSLVERIVQARKDKNLTAEQVKKITDEGSYTASGALKAGLVDRLAYADDYRDHLKDVLKKQHQAEQFTFVKDYGKEEKKDIDFANPFALFKLLATPAKSKSSSSPK